MQHNIRKTSLKIALIYGMIGVLWILLSDKFVAFFYSDPVTISKIQTFKGWFFILVTTALFYFLIKKDFTKTHLAQEKIEADEKKIKALAESTEDLIVRFDKNFKCKYVSPSVEKLLNISMHIFTSKTLDELDLPLGTLNSLKGAISDVFDKGISKRIELGLTDNLWFDWLLYPEFDKENRLVSVLASARNISDRKIMEDRLKESEEKFRILFEEGNDAVFLLKDKKIYDCNEKACELLEVSKIEIFGKTPFDFSPEIQPDGENSKEKTSEIFNNINDLNPEIFEWKMKTKKGLLIDVEVSLTSVLLGKTNFVQAILRNITERKTYQQALEFNQYTIDITNEAVYWINRFGAIIYANHNASDMLGYSGTELKQKYLWDIDPFYKREKWPQTWEEFSSTKKITFESTQKKKDGEILPVEIIGNYVKYGGKEIICAFVRDISARKKAEKNLIESENRFRSLLNSTAALIFIIIDNKMVFVNNVSLSTLGYYEDEVIGRNMIDFIHDDYHELVLQKSGDRFMGKRGPDRYMLGCKSVKGEKVLLDFTSDVILYNGVNAIIGTAIDITEKVKAQEALEESRQKFAELYEQSSKILENERRRLSKELHDVIGQRLTFTKLNLEIFEEEKKINDPKLNMVMENLVTLGQDLRTVVQSLTPSIIEEYPLDEAVRILVERECRISEIKFDLKVNFDAPIDNKVIELEVYRIIQESITNTIKHSSADYVEIDLTTKNKKLFCLIKDNGKGFANSKNRGKIPSWGLVHMKDRAQILGGTLNINSAEGEGTNIKLEVPVG